MLKRLIPVLVLVATPALAQTRATEGILLLAHGGAADWNERVAALARTVDQTQPVEVAFGMASRPAIQQAVDKLVARGVTSIVAVPLFVSSHSSVITSTAYLLGARAEMPPELKIYAKMNHGGQGGAQGGSGHEGHTVADTSADNMRPVQSPVSIRMTDALNRHEQVGAILIDRARDISTVPAREAVIIVAHGPVPDDDNERWLADMQVLAKQVAASTSFAALDVLTLRDDAPKPIRDAATAQLRHLAQGHIAAGRRVLIVPLLISFGGIERGLRERLEGLDYTMAKAALMPDDRLASWVLAMAGQH